MSMLSNAAKDHRLKFQSYISKNTKPLPVTGAGHSRLPDGYSYRSATCSRSSADRRADIGPYLQEKWASLSDHPIVGETRMVGLMGALELVADKSSLARFDEEIGAGTICRDFLVDNGLVMRAVGDTIVVAPPLILSHEEADELIEITLKCLDLTLAAATA